MKIKKRDVRSRLRGRRTCGYGSRKKHRGKGSRGGRGMAGTGKRAGQKITLVLKKYGKYLGKRGFVSRKKLQEKRKKIINLKDLIYDIEKYQNQNKIDLNKIDLSEYKVIGSELSQDILKNLEKLKGKEIICKEITQKLKKKLEDMGIKITIKAVKESVKDVNVKDAKEIEAEQKERKETV